jgi:hypothetical protein
MKKTLTIIATAALMGSTTFAPLAVAQDANPTSPSAPTTQSPAAPVAPNAATPLMTTPDSTTSVSGAYLSEQGTDQVSANDYIGNAVYASGDESIGTINDIILQDNGGIVAAVVGVGGFLGIGEKNVAMPMDKLTVTRDTETGAVRLTTTETAEALQAAPEFITLEEKRDAQSAAAPAMPDSTTTSSTSP